jgi:hypothetical protein
MAGSPTDRVLAKEPKLPRHPGGLPLRRGAAGGKARPARTTHTVQNEAGAAGSTSENTPNPHGAADQDQLARALPNPHPYPGGVPPCQLTSGHRQNQAHEPTCG